MTELADTEAVWRALSARLRGFVAKRVANPDDVDDIVQTVFLRVHAGLDDVRDRERLLGWIFQIARNAVTDHYRAAPRRRELPTEFVPDRAAETGEHDDDAAEVRRELAECLEPMLASLAPHYREALELTELGGMTQAAAASHLGMSVSGMKSRVQRGRGQLLDILHDCCAFSLDGRGAPIAYRSRCSACDS